MTLNLASDVKRKLKGIGDEYSDDDLNSELDEAYRKLQARCGKHYIQNLMVKNTDVTEYELDFDGVESFDKVVREDEETEVSSDNYTQSNGVITFDSTWMDDEVMEEDVLDLFYVPSVFKDLELLYACISILSYVKEASSDEVTKNTLQGFKETTKELENLVNGRGGTRALRTHKPFYNHRYSSGGHGSR